MDGWRDFTFDPLNYPLPEMQRFVRELHARQQRWVPIVDPGFKVDQGYQPYDEGLKEDIFMKGVDGENYLGWVSGWPWVGRQAGGWQDLGACPTRQGGGWQWRPAAAGLLRSVSGTPV